MHKIKRLALDIHHPHRLAHIETVLSLIACFILLTGQAAAVVRFQNRNLYISNPNPGASSVYTVSMQYTTLTSIGSLDLQFCVDPIPGDPCDAPVGINASHAVLSSQSGETGYTISKETSDEIVLSRNPAVAQPNIESVYVFSGIINPISTTDSFSIRMSDYASTDASGPIVDLGSEETQLTSAIELETQVPPMLIFCAAQEVSTDCSTTDDNNYSDLGTLSSNDTLTTQSQMAAGTNASSGYVITANGTSMEAGSSIIGSPSTPTPSNIGTNQFGINLVANTSPSVGADPDYNSNIAQPTSNYSIPNEFMFQDGDVVAQSPHVSLVQRYTISYILNSSPSLQAGIYSTTITYVCSGRF
jgi:hypothetical protein